MNLDKSLQALKADIAKKEETLKALQKTYPHLANLSETQILTYFEVSTIPELIEHIKRIKAFEEPDENLTATQGHLCSCTDSKGQPKEIYDSEASAQREITLLETEKRVKLSVYICPDGFGWHLTKR